MLALIAALVQGGLASRILIVVPANLLGTWEAELRQWHKAGAIELVVTVVHAGQTGLQPVHHMERLSETTGCVCSSLPLLVGA